MHRSAIAPLVLAVSLFAAATPARAQQLAVTSYDMLNGQTGSYTYMDNSYNGVGCGGCQAAPLFGGTGKLTDGYFQTLNWSPAMGVGYVGWWQFDPSILFHFATGSTFGQIRVGLDNPLGEGPGGVRPPTIIRVGADDGVGGFAAGYQDFVQSPVQNGSPYWADLDVSSLGAIQNQSAVRMQLFRSPGYYLMASEVEFTAAAVVATPEPASLVLLGTGLLGVIAVARRRRPS